MGEKKEIRNEESFNWNTFSFEKKEVHYVDGKKVGETKHEQTFLGTPVDKNYDSEGNLVSTTKYEDTVFHGTVGKTYDPDGNVISETQGEKRILNDTTDWVIYQKGKEVGRLRREDRLSDNPDERRRVLIEKPGKDIDTLRRSTREKQEGRSDGYSGYYDTSPTHHEQPKDEKVSSDPGFGWVFFFEAAANIAHLLGLKKVETGCYNQVAGIHRAWRRYLLAGKSAEKAGDIQNAVVDYARATAMQEDFSRKGEKLARQHNLEHLVFEQYAVFCAHEKAADFARQIGKLEEAVDLYHRAALNMDDKRSFTYVSLLRHAGDLALEIGNKEKALHLYEAAHVIYKAWSEEVVHAGESSINAATALYSEEVKKKIDKLKPKKKKEK